MNNMFSIWQFWFEEYIKEIRMYMKYMFNDYFVIVLIFFIVGVVSWYSKWVKDIFDYFLLFWVMVVFFLFVLMGLYVWMLLKEVDFVFLLLFELKMGIYFKYLFKYSYLLQLFLFFVLLFVCMFLFFVVSLGVLFMLYVVVFIQMLVVKVWNQVMEWWMIFMNDRSMKMMDVIICFICNMLFLYFIL